jgi:multidrug resistance efflux pump
MLDVKFKSKPENSTGQTRSGSLSPQPRLHPVPVRRWQHLPLIITFVTVGLAAALSWAMWTAYMETPWTRDGTVRAYIVTMAPEVAGRIVELGSPTTSLRIRVIC